VTVGVVRRPGIDLHRQNQVNGGILRITKRQDCALFPTFVDVGGIWPQVLYTQGLQLETHCLQALQTIRDHPDAHQI